MITYEIKYKSTEGSVQVARVSANSACQAVFAFLEDYDLPVISATRTDLLFFAESMKRYEAVFSGRRGTRLLPVYARCWGDAARDAKAQEVSFGKLQSVCLSSKPSDMLPINKYKVSYKNSDGSPERMFLFGDCEETVKDVFERFYEKTADGIEFVRPATPGEIDMIAGGAPHPKH